jgi:hypothetical protein
LKGSPRSRVRLWREAGGKRSEITWADMVKLFWRIASWLDERRSANDAFFLSLRVLVLSGLVVTLIIGGPWGVVAFVLAAFEIVLGTGLIRKRYFSERK